MPKLRYPFFSNILFYLAVAGYAYLVASMTQALWFGDGVNVFASYSDAPAAAGMVVDANKVYWSKTGFLFLSMLLFGFNVDYRAAVGLAMTFWGVSLTVIFGATPVLLTATALGLALTVLQIYRKNFWS